jgi:zeaxanthin glucosyltransferase
MSRIVVASYSLMGHYRPMVRVIRELVTAGHDVLFVSEAAIAAELGCTRATLGFAKPTVPVGEARTATAGDPAAELAWRKTAVLDAAETMIEPFRALIRDFRPDVVAADSMMHAPFIAAHVEGVRSVSIFKTNLNLFMHTYDSPLREQARIITPDLAHMFTTRGLAAEFRILHFISPTLNVSFTTEALLGAGADVPARTELVGPSIPDEPASAHGFPFHLLAGDRPVVYVSFGSVNFWQPALTRIVAQAVEPLGAQLVISCSTLADSEHVKNLPGNPLVASIVPQPMLLDRTAVFVTHAGGGSVMDACYAGVPVLAVPLIGDQPANAHVIAHTAKIGLTIPPAQLGVDNCRDALVKLLAQPNEFRERLAPIKTSYRARNGGALAAAAITRVALAERS